jgi:two-component system, OmpR family, copper resistance phosphate regulon response regulator CusR
VDDNKKTMKILVAEDEKAISALIRKGLEMEGYSVETVFDGQEAYRKIIAGKYDLVLMDVMLPTITGVDATKLLRKEKIKTPILMLTARDGIDERDNAFAAGVNDYLLKPFSFDHLISRVRALIK